MSIRKNCLKYILLPVLLLAFCDDGGDPTGPSGNVESSGAFTVTINEADSVVSASGLYFDGPKPESTVWDEVMKDGDMVLLTPRRFDCPEACGSGFKCVEGNVCMAEPSPIGVGAITLSGMTVKDEEPKDLTVKAVGTAKYYSPTDIFAYPPFAEGAPVTIAAAGSDASPAFTLSLKGITPIRVLNETIPLETGKAITLQWVPPADQSSSVIEVMLDISYHGGTKAKILGQTADDGELLINAPILDKLISYGIAGFPRIDVIRKTEAYDEASKTRFVIESTVSYELAIPGVNSCNKFADCPADMGYTRCSELRKCE